MEVLRDVYRYHYVPDVTRLLLFRRLSESQKHRIIDTSMRLFSI